MERVRPTRVAIVAMRVNACVNTLLTPSYAVFYPTSFDLPAKREG